MKHRASFPHRMDAPDRHNGQTKQTNERTVRPSLRGIFDTERCNPRIEGNVRSNHAEVRERIQQRNTDGGVKPDGSGELSCWQSRGPPRASLLTGADHRLQAVPGHSPPNCVQIIMPPLHLPSLPRRIHSTENNKNPAFKINIKYQIKTTTCLPLYIFKIVSWLLN